MGAVTGTVEDATDLPVGTLELELFGEDGKPLAGVPVRLGQVALQGTVDGQHVKVHQGKADENGRARFEGLTTGASAGYAAVFDRAGTRVSTEPFRMSTESGMRGKLRALGQTNDTSVLRIDQRSRVALDTREENITVMIAMVFQNVSNQTFDPGPGGILVKLPPGATGAQEIEGGSPVEVTAEGVRIHVVIPPNSAATFAAQALFGYVLKGEGDGTVEVRQPLPAMMEDPLIIVPVKSNLEVKASGLKFLSEESGRNGDKLKLYRMPAVPASSPLTLSVSGVPVRDRSGAVVASGLCLLLVVAALVWARPPSSAADAEAAKAALVQRREKLFSELVALERKRKASTSDSALDARRRELVASLDVVYRDLATREAV
jgi:hypothetical protein